MSSTSTVYQVFFVQSLGAASPLRILGSSIELPLDLAAAIVKASNKDGKRDSNAAGEYFMKQHETLIPYSVRFNDGDKLASVSVHSAFLGSGMGRTWFVNPSSTRIAAIRLDETWIPIHNATIFICKYAAPIVSAAIRENPAALAAYNAKIEQRAIQGHLRDLQNIAEILGTFAAMSAEQAADLLESAHSAVGTTETMAVAERVYQAMQLTRAIESENDKAILAANKEQADLLAAQRRMIFARRHTLNPTIIAEKG